MRISEQWIFEHNRKRSPQIRVTKKVFLTKGMDEMVFDSSKEACKFLCVKPSTLSQSIKYGYKIKNWQLQKLEVEDE